MNPLGYNEPLVSVHLASEDETRAFGARLAELLSGGGFLGLVGNLGAGKTTLVQGLVGALADGAEATSPTYTLLHEYEGDPPIYHFDLYRLGSVDELETVAYWDYAEDRDAVVVVEWLDQVEAAWPGEGLVVSLLHEGGMRRAEIRATPRWQEPVRALKLA